MKAARKPAQSRPMRTKAEARVASPHRIHSHDQCRSPQNWVSNWRPWSLGGSTRKDTPQQVLPVPRMARKAPRRPRRLRSRRAARHTTQAARGGSAEAGADGAGETCTRVSSVRTASTSVLMAPTVTGGTPRPKARTAVAPAATLAVNACGASGRVIAAAAPPRTAETTATIAPACTAVRLVMPRETTRPRTAAMVFRTTTGSRPKIFMRVPDLGGLGGDGEAVLVAEPLEAGLAGDAVGVAAGVAEALLPGRVGG